MMRQSSEVHTMQGGRSRHYEEKIGDSFQRRPPESIKNLVDISQNISALDSERSRTSSGLNNLSNQLNNKTAIDRSFSGKPPLALHRDHSQQALGQEA